MSEDVTGLANASLVADSVSSSTPNSTSQSNTNSQSFLQSVLQPQQSVLDRAQCGGDNAQTQVQLQPPFLSRMPFNQNNNIRTPRYIFGDIDLSYEVLLNLTTCSICLEQFKDPKSLPCLHSFCKRCLITLIETVVHTHPFPCPTCRRLCHATVSSLPDDFKSKLLVDTMRQREKQHPNSSLSKNSVSSQSQLSTTSQNQPVLCKTHGNRRCEFFCEMCSVAICVKCVNMEHSNHCYIDVFEDSQCLIKELEIVVESAKRDIEKLEGTNTDIDIMLSEFNYNLEERVKKLKKLVDQTAAQIKNVYAQDVIAIQNNIRKQINDGRSFVSKSNDYLNRLKASIKDCSTVFDVYADSKMHLENNQLNSSRYLTEIPAKFEFSPCVEFQITQTLSQFFGQVAANEQHHSDQLSQIVNQLSLPSSSMQSTSQMQHSSSSSPLLTRVGNTNDFDSNGLTNLASDSQNSQSAGSNGAKRKRQYHTSTTNLRRASPAVEALFSSATQSDRSSPRLTSTPDVSQDYASSSSSNSEAMSILRSILPSNSQIVSTNNSNEHVTSDVSVTHPLTPLLLSSFRNQDSSANLSDPLLFITRSQNSTSTTESTGQVNRASANHSASDIIVPLIDLMTNNNHGNNNQHSIMQPYDVQMFFQSIINSESRLSGTQESTFSATDNQEFTNDSSSAIVSNSSGAVSTEISSRSGSADIAALFPDLSISSAHAEDSLTAVTDAQDPVEIPDRPVSPRDANIAEETL